LIRFLFKDTFKLDIRNIYDLVLFEKEKKKCNPNQTNLCGVKFASVVVCVCTYLFIKARKKISIIKEN